MDGVVVCGLGVAQFNPGDVEGVDVDQGHEFGSHGSRDPPVQALERLDLVVMLCATRVRVGGKGFQTCLGLDQGVTSLPQQGQLDAVL
uniref:Uncharacterized protein n=1 Tax=Streptomyces auratus AGR0001 TaxID=1160718 RepID=J2JQB2_9ACTN